MVAKTNAVRQITETSQRKIIPSQLLAHMIVKGVPQLDSRFLLLALLLLGCSGSQIKTDPTPDLLTKECGDIGTFLSSEAVRASDLAQVREKAAKIIAQNRSISMQNCPAYATLERLVRQIGARFPSDPAWAAEYAATEKLSQAITEKNEGFRWQLPGDKKVGSRATYIKRLATTADRARRQSIYKLFNSSRSRRWLTWGFKDLVAQRNKEAKAAGNSSYVEYMYRRNGLNYSQSMEVVEAIKDRIGPAARRKIRQLAEAQGIADLEPWDIYFLMDKSFGGNPSKSITPFVVAEYVRIFMNGLGLNEINPGSISIDNPVVKTDFGTVAGLAALEIYPKHIKQPIIIFQRPSESAKEAIFETLRFLALDSPLLSPALQKYLGNLSPAELSGLKPHGYAPFAWSAYRFAWLFEFEKRMYEQPDADLLELWSKVSEEFWGVEVSAFYGGFDEDEYLNSPTAFAEKAVGAVAAAGITDGAYRQFSQNLGPGFGAGLKADCFAGGSEVLTMDMLPKVSKVNWTVRTLMDLLVASLEN